MAIMSDLISRKETICYIRENLPLGTFMHRGIKQADIACWDVCNMIADRVPSAESEEKWIPVTEALPEEGRYLVTRYDYVTKSSFIDILWFEKNTWWNRQITGNFSVLAWMPLPEPWRGEYEN